MKGSAQKQRGVALLATIMAVALMTTLVVDFTYSASQSQRFAANQLNELRADYLARSAVQVGMGLMTKDVRSKMETQQPQYDSLQDIWATPFPPLPVEGGTVTVSIVDETRKLNINSLLLAQSGAANPASLQVLSRLLANIGVSDEIIPALIDWLDPDSITSQGGAEADYYLGLRPPYEPRNGPMPTIGDLRMIRGIDDATFNRMRLFLTTTPETKVNINTAAPEVLSAILPQLGNEPSLLKSLIEARTQAPFKTVLDLNNVPGLSAFTATFPTLFTTQSDYFTITGLGEYAGARKLVYATVQRNGINPMVLASWHED